MKQFFIKIGRFFWSRGFLKFVLGVVAIVIIFYIVQDWRGAGAWSDTKAYWEGKGESFDYNRLIPPPIPDDQNLAVIPLFKLEPDPENKEELAPLALQKAFRRDMPGNKLYFPHSDNWHAGQAADMASIRAGIAADYVEAFGPPSIDSLAQFDALYPFVADLRAAAASRLYCRFPHEYPPQPPYHDLLTLVTPQIQLAKILNLHALLALDAHRPDLALADIQTNFKLTSGLMKEPFLVSGLVAIGMTAICGKGALYDGLVSHSWNDVQLTELQNELAKMDFLSAYQLDLRGELGISFPALDKLKGYHSQDPEMKSFGYDFLADWWPGGWIDWNKAQVLEMDMRAVHYVDPQNRLVFPQDNDRLSTENQKQQSGPALAPWNIFASTSSSALGSGLQKFSQMQVWVDEARIVCALERYHLHHNAYPDSLDALVPACIVDVPYDVMNGELYHYQLRPDGSFLLYSVGWNQKDDGGKIVYKKDAPAQVDYNLGDWVWPVP